MKKKFIAFALCLMMAIPVVGVGAAYAGNYTDTAFQFDFRNGGSWVTASRAKQDYTSSYMKCTRSGGGLSYKATAVARSGSSIIYVGSPTYSFTTGTTRYLVNYVKESGYNYASIYATPNSSAAYTAIGLWSPDSI